MENYSEYITYVLVMCHVLKRQIVGIVKKQKIVEKMNIFDLKDKHIISIDPKNLEDHPLSRNIFGDLSETEYGKLKKDIIERGIQDPLHVVKRNDKWIVISGHQRKRVAIEININVPCIDRKDLVEDWQIEEQLIKDNLVRRHLSDYQRYKSGNYLETIEKKKAKQREKIRKGKQPGASVVNLPHLDKGKSRDKVAKQLDISGKQYDNIKYVGKNAPYDIKEKWKNREITTHTAKLRTEKHVRKQKREQKKKEKEEKQKTLPIYNHTYENIKNMDCIEFLNTIEDNSIDLVLTDPPYKISKKTGFIKMSELGVDRLGVSMDFGDWDKNFNDLDIAIDEFYRVLKPSGTVIIFYDLWKITNIAKMLKKAKFKQLRFIEWVKTNPVPLNSKINYLTNTREIAITAVKNGNATFNSEYDNGIYFYPIFQNGERFHPTQKPVSLFEELIKKHSIKNDTVLDCFLGSGTTALASKKLNRKFKGCEIDKKYYNLMIKRLNNGNGK